jgi:hypothetical protein
VYGQNCRVGAAGSLDNDLRAYLQEVTLKVIREEVYADTSDAPKVGEALPAADRRRPDPNATDDVAEYPNGGNARMPAIPGVSENIP